MKNAPKIDWTEVAAKAGITPVEAAAERHAEAVEGLSMRTLVKDLVRVLREEGGRDDERE